MKFVLQSSVLDLKTILLDMANGAIDVVPKLLMAIVILIVGTIVAKIVTKVTKRALVIAKVDKLGDSLNNVDIVHKANMKIELSTVFSKALYYFMMLIVLVLASTALGMPEVTDLIKDILLFLPNLLVALIVMILGTLLADAIKSMVGTALKSLGVPSANMIATVLFYFLFINVIMIALKQANVQTDFLAQNISILIAGVIAAFAIGYGLASKDTMSNLLASFYGKNIFKNGDKVTIDGVTGVVSDIDKTKITLRTENSTVIIPLSKATGNKIELHD